jgi:hypothetical protein
MNLTTKNISINTRKINATITKEQIYDLKQYSRYYVLKRKIDNIINNDLISFEERDELTLYVNINNKLFERLQKLYKITKDESSKEIIEYVEYVKKNLINSISEMESVLVEELTTSINKEILNKIMNLKKYFIVFTILIASVGLDQWTKALAVEKMSNQPPIYFFKWNFSDSDSMANFCTLLFGANCNKNSMKESLEKYLNVKQSKNGISLDWELLYIKAIKS